MRYASGMSSRRLPVGDSKLIQIVDAALAETTRRSGRWLVCRPGCTQCCVGVFAINQLDAVRLQRGLARLKNTDPQRARRIRERAQASVKRLSAEFPGNAKTGVLDGYRPGTYFTKQTGEIVYSFDPLRGACRSKACLGK